MAEVKKIPVRKKDEEIKANPWTGVIIANSTTSGISTAMISRAKRGHSLFG